MSAASCAGFESIQVGHGKHRDVYVQGWCRVKSPGDARWEPSSQTGPFGERGEGILSQR